PYPSGILTHQSMDALRTVVLEHDIAPDDVERIDFHAGDNILDPIRYGVATTGLEAKFSINALLSMIILFRRATFHEFEDGVVRSAAFQAMQRRVHTHRDPHINSLGFDRIRSRMEVTLKDGTVRRGEADLRYR